MSYDNSGYRRGGIPTLYNGVEYKSKIESQIALFLDGVEIKHQYEPQSFLLASGRHFCPDFFCPEIKLWVEVKTRPNPYVLDDLRDLVQTTQQEALLFTAEEQIIVPSPDSNYIEGVASLMYCGKCDSVSIQAKESSWFCRKCGAGTGDKEVWGDLCLDKNNLVVVNYGNANDIVKNAKKIEQIRKKFRGDFSVNKDEKNEF